MDQNITNVSPILWPQSFVNLNQILLSNSHFLLNSGITLTYCKGHTLEMEFIIQQTFLRHLMIGKYLISTCIACLQFFHVAELVAYIYLFLQLFKHNEKMTKENQGRVNMVVKFSKNFYQNQFFYTNQDEILILDIQNIDALLNFPAKHQCCTFFTKLYQLSTKYKVLAYRIHPRCANAHTCLRPTLER